RQPPPTSHTAPFPYTTLFRSVGAEPVGRELAPTGFGEVGGNAPAPGAAVQPQRSCRGCDPGAVGGLAEMDIDRHGRCGWTAAPADRKSTRLNCSHRRSAYAVV